MSNPTISAAPQRPPAHPVRPAPSLWADTAVDPPALEPLRGERRADAVVVGGGFTGLSSALHLREAGLDVAVVEAAEIGSGASGRNNGQVIPTLSKLDPDGMVARYGQQAGERFAALVRDSAGLLFDIVRRHGLDCDAVQNGWLQPAHSPGRFALSQRRWAQWEALGADGALLDREEMARRLGSDGHHGGILMRQGGHINPLGLARELARKVTELGGTVFVRSPATAVNHAAGEGWTVETGGGRVVAPVMIAATNTYTSGVFDRLRRSVVPVVSWQCSTAPLSANVRESVLPGQVAASDTRAALRFFRPTADGRIVTGGALVSSRNGEERLATLAAERLRETFPQLGTVAIDHVWNGYVGMTPDFAPRVHELGPDGYAWVGCNGRGVALGVALGRELARLVAGTDRDDLALPFEPDAPLAFHGLMKGLAPLMLARYRRRDEREIRG